jgi:hypothetical protein
VKGVAGEWGLAVTADKRRLGRIGGSVTLAGRMGKASRSKRARRAVQPRGDRRELVERLRAYESRIDESLPGWTEQMDRLRDVGRREHGSWPAWCLLPMTAPYAVAVHYGLLRADGMDAGGRPDIAGLQWPGVLAALYAWRQGRGIYRYDAELADAVAASDLPADIGTDMLFRLPEWGVYIDPAGALGDEIVGLWVHLEWDVARECAELRFVWDMAPDAGGGSLEILAVPLGQSSLAAAMDAAMDNARSKANRAGLTENDLESLGGSAEFNFDLIRRAVLLVLYLCTADADVSNPDRPGVLPRRVTQPRATEAHWEVGYRIGTALRASRAAAAGSRGGSHAAPAPHLRRAHWHTYWTGPEDGDRRRVLKWLAPIAVGVGGALPTFHDSR